MPAFKIYVRQSYDYFRVYRDASCTEQVKALTRVCPVSCHKGDKLRARKWFQSLMSANQQIEWMN